jgi:hypothetical protein
MSIAPAKKQRFSFDRLLERRWFLPTVAVVALFAGVLIRQYARETYRDSIGSFFDAIFIAAFLASVVDPVLKLGFLKGAAKDVFALIYGYKLPPELQAFFDDTIAGTKVIRRDCELHWTIRKHPSVADRVVLKLHASFDLLNFTRDRYDYTHQVAAIADAPGENGSVDFMYCRIRPGNAYFYQCEKGSLVTGKNSVNPGKPVPLDPRAGLHSQYRVGVHYQSEAPLVNGVDQFGFSEVTTNVQVIVTVDPEFRGYKYSLIPMPKLEDEPVAPVFDVQSQEYRCSWTFDRVFVPNESLILRWQAPAPRPAAAPAAASRQEVVSVRTH